MKHLVREAEPADLPCWVAMRCSLWPDEDPEALALEARTMREWEPACTAFLAEGPHGRLLGFIEVGMRGFAEGCPAGKCAYVEGIWVEPDCRRSGIGRGLLDTAEAWAVDNGLAYVGSDALLANVMSHGWHKAAGFREIVRIVTYAKRIG